MICLPRIFCPPLARRCSLMRSPELNPKTEPLTQRAAHGGRYTVQRGRSASESTKGGAVKIYAQIYLQAPAE